MLINLNDSLASRSMSAYLGWLKNLSWLMYANEAMTIIQYEGVKNISEFNQSANSFVEMTHHLSLPGCAGIDPQAPCLSTADEVLDQYSFSKDNLAIDIWALALLYATYNALAVFCLWRRARQACR